LLPAEWQETIKNRSTTTYEGWLTRVIDHESVDPDRRRWWFWKVHDTLEILRIWGRNVPPERIHVITMPPRGSAPTLLWDRYSRVVGIDPKVVDTSAAKTNSSLSVPQIELIRRLNLAIPAEMPDWFYMHFVKGALAHNAFADRTDPAQRLGLPVEREEWALKAADALIAALDSSGYEIVGDLKELRPAETSAVKPSSETAAEGIAEAGVVAVTAVLAELQQTTLQFMAKNPDAVPESWLQVRRVPRGPVKNFVVEMSERHRSMHALRSGWWRTANMVRRVTTKQPFRGR
jgi:hypothetical protein